MLQGSILFPLLFLIFVIDVPNVWFSSEVFFLFAHDTSIIGFECWGLELAKDVYWLLKIFQWTKLALNVDETVHMKITNKNASNSSLKNDKFAPAPQKFSKYFGVISDSNLCFHSHIDEIRLKLGRQCGIVARVRHSVPKGALVRFSNSNSKSLLQYELLVHGCFSLINDLSKVLIKQRKDVRLKFSLKSTKKTGTLFVKSQILTLNRFLIYELINLFYVLSGDSTSGNLRESNDPHFVLHMASSRVSQNLNRRDFLKGVTSTTYFKKGFFDRIYPHVCQRIQKLRNNQNPNDRKPKLLWLGKPKFQSGTS